MMSPHNDVPPNTQYSVDADAPKLRAYVPEVRKFFAISLIVALLACIISCVALGLGITAISQHSNSENMTPTGRDGRDGRDGREGAPGPPGPPGQASVVVPSYPDISAGLRRRDIFLEMIVHNAGTPFWDAIKQGATTAGRDLGIDLHYVSQTNPFDFEQLSRSIKEATFRLKDGVAVSLPSVNDVRTAVSIAMQEMPIVTVNVNGQNVISTWKEEGALIHVGQVPVVAGEAAGRKLGGLVPAEDVKDGNQCLCVIHEYGSGDLEAVCDGFQKGLQASTSLESHTLRVPDLITSTNRRHELTAALNATNVVCLLLLSGDTAGIGKDALTTATKNPKTFPWGVMGESTIASKLITEKDLRFMVSEQPYLQGYLPILYLTLFNLYSLRPLGVSSSVNILPTGPYIKDWAVLQRDARFSTVNDGDESTEKYRISVVVHGQEDDPFWWRVRNGVKLAGRDMGVHVHYRHVRQECPACDPQNWENMKQLVLTELREGAHGLIVSIPSTDVFPTEEVTNAQIPVISINSNAFENIKSPILLHIGQHEYQAGIVAAQQLVRLSRDSIGQNAALHNLNLLCLIHEELNHGLQQRCSAVFDHFANVTFNGVEISTEVVNGTATVQSKLENASSSSQTDENTLWVIVGTGAVATHMMDPLTFNEDRTISCTFDLSPEILDMILSRKISFALDQQQYLQGYLPVAYIATVLRTNNIPAENEFHDTGPLFVDATNAALVLDLSRKHIR